MTRQNPCPSSPSLSLAFFFVVAQSLCSERFTLSLIFAEHVFLSDDQQFLKSHFVEPEFLPEKANRHTIILMQTSQNRATRTFMDYDSISQAMDGICRLYERKLKDLNPANQNITYDIADLYNFIDGLADMSALVYEHSIQAYLPYDRQWIKQRTLQHLRRMAH